MGADSVFTNLFNAIGSSCIFYRNGIQTLASAIYNFGGSYIYLLAGGMLDGSSAGTSSNRGLQCFQTASARIRYMAIHNFTGSGGNGIGISATDYSGITDDNCWFTGNDTDKIPAAASDPSWVK
jgi:hypothetical protein